MIKDEEICNHFETLLYILRHRELIEPTYLAKIKILIYRIRSGEVILRGVDEVYETHGNGD